MGNLATDRAEWLGYVAATQARFVEHGDYVWRSPDTLRRPVPATLLAPFDGVAVDGFTGAWHVVRKYATTEFVRFFEDGLADRITFAEWRARAISERDAQAARDAEWLDSFASPLAQLAMLRDLQSQRDALILQARERGAGWREIGDSVGMSRAQLHNIATRYIAPVAVAYDPDEPF